MIVSVGIGEKLISGTAWMLAMRWLSRLMGLLSMVIVARLLAPEDFGVYAVATAIIGLIDAFTDMGTDLAIIRHGNPQRQHYDTAWTFRIIIHIVSSLIILLTAPLAAKFYNDIRYEAVLQVLAISMFISGFANIGVANFRRKLNFSRDFQYNTLVQFVGVLATLGLAYFLRSYWALVLGGLVRSIGAVALSYLMQEYRPKLSLDARKEMFGFSFWVMVRSVALFMTGSGDRLIIGAFFAATITGWYAVAATLASMAVFELLHPIGRALFPGLAAKQDDPVWMARNLKIIFSAVATISIPAGLGLSVLASPALEVVYGGQFTGAGPMLAILAITAAVTGLSQPVGQYLVVVGRVRQLAIIYAIEGVVALGVTYQLATSGQDILVIIYARLFISVLALARVFYLIETVRHISWRDIASGWLRPIISGAVMYFILDVYKTYMDGYAAGFIVVIGVPLGIFVYVITLLSVWYLMGKPEGVEGDLIRRLAPKDVAS